jgi:hypothetical protein
MTGIFDSNPNRNPFAGANLAFAGYCSSDAWVGNAGVESNDMGWVFRGQANVAALYHTLSSGPVSVVYETRTHFANHTHLDVNTTVTAQPLASGDRVLFAGASAGARGALFTADYLLPEGIVPAGVSLSSFFDSPLWVDVLPLESNITSLENQTQMVFARINATGRLGVECAKAYPGSEGWKCLFGAYRLPFVRSPFLLSASQFDKYQLPYNEGADPPYTGDELTYAAAFQTAVRSVVLTLPTAAQPGSAVYSSACFKHVTSTIASFWGVYVDDMNLKNYLALWFFGSTSPAAHVDLPASAGASMLPPAVSAQRIEDCTGFGCGQCHSKTHPNPLLTGSDAAAQHSLVPRPRRQTVYLWAAVFAGLAGLTLCLQRGVLHVSGWERACDAEGRGNWNRCWGGVGRAGGKGAEAARGEVRPLLAREAVRFKKQAPSGLSDGL